VRTDYFTPDPGIAREDWFLIVSALEPYKRIDLAISAARQAGLPLKIVGDGSQFLALRRSAPPQVQLLGRVNDRTLLDLYRRARALMYTQVEDFGITAVEAQATGCPVIAFRAGGAMETVTPDTGAFLEHQSVAAMLRAINEFDPSRFSPTACRNSALRFSEATFDHAILLHVLGLVGAAA
jgi:glycosyltransferase involved in cell wall biosynthesis